MCGISGIYSKDEDLEFVLNKFNQTLKNRDQIIHSLLKRITLGWVILDCQY